MGHFMVAGRPSAKSFSHAAVKTYVAALAQRKHRAECRDLMPRFSTQSWCARICDRDKTKSPGRCRGFSFHLVEILQVKMSNLGGLGLNLGASFRGCLDLDQKRATPLLV